MTYEDLNEQKIRAATEALWNEFCPGCRITKEDAQIYREAAIKVLEAAGALYTPPKTTWDKVWEIFDEQRQALDKPPPQPPT